MAVFMGIAMFAGIVASVSLAVAYIVNADELTWCEED